MTKTIDFTDDAIFSPSLFAFNLFWINIIGQIISVSVFHIKNKIK